MNIFVIDPDPRICAQALDDLRLNKMILETAQLLSTAIRYHGYTGNLAYKSTHVNHPCSIWARACLGNYRWLLNYFSALTFERAARTGKTHKCESLYTLFRCNEHLIPTGPLTTFANCSLYKDHGTFDAYKLTMIDKWAKDKRPPKWTNAQKPSWA